MNRPSRKPRFELRERQDGYTVRLNLPDLNLHKVEAVWSGETLRVVAPEGKEVRRERDIRLLGVPRRETNSRV